jgi:hypothetical protein
MPLALRGRLRSNGTRYPNRRLYFAALESGTSDTPISENTPSTSLGE